MSAVQVCTCGSIGADPKTVRLAECHHRYFRGDKELVSVSKILRSVWPIKPDYSAAPTEVLENARLRGIDADTLVSLYVEGKLREGTLIREDALMLFREFRPWWKKREHRTVRAQVILADDEVAGTCDLMPDQSIYDLKTTYDIEAYYPLQLGAYGELYKSMYGVFPDALGIIHLTKRFNGPRFINLDIEECVRDWKLMRAVWTMAQRRIQQR